MRIQLQKQVPLSNVLYNILLHDVKKYVLREVLRDIVKNTNNNGIYKYMFQNFYDYLKYLGVDDKDIRKLWNMLIKKVLSLSDGFYIEYNKNYIKLIKKRFL